MAVPAGDGLLHCLSTADGSLLGQLDCGAEVRAPPGTDPWVGLWWLVTHSKELLAVDPHSLVVVSRWAKQNRALGLLQFLQGLAKESV